MADHITEEEYNKLSFADKQQYYQVQSPIQYTHKLKRNLGCPCNSGLKYKKCCLYKKPAIVT